MSSENLFNEDFSEEIITELEKQYGTDYISHDANGMNTENHLVYKSEDTEKNNKSNLLFLDDQMHSATNDRKLFQLPLTRIRNIMKLDPEVHIVSNEAVFLVTRATELFIEALASESYNFTMEGKKKTVQKRDVDLAIEAVDSLMFLDGAMIF